MARLEGWAANTGTSGLSFETRASAPPQDEVEFAGQASVPATHFRFHEFDDPVEH